MADIDWKALAAEYRRLRDQLAANLPTLDGLEAEVARRTLGHVDRVVAAIANRDHKAIAELLRQGEAAQRALDGSTSVH